MFTFQPTFIKNSSEINSQGAPSAVSHSALIGLWRGAPAFGDTGIEAVTATLAFSVFEIPAIPDLSSAGFTDYAKLDKNQRVGQMGERINRFLASLHQSLGVFSAVSLRYFFQPQSDGGRIRLFLIGRSCGQDLWQATDGIRRFREIVKLNFPNEYRLIDHCELDEQSEIFRKVLFLEGVRSAAELLKPEDILTSWHKPEHCGFSFYYVPKFFEPAPNDMIDFCRSMMRETHGREAIVDVCLIPTPEITEVERSHLGQWKSICDHWGRSFEQKVGGGLFSEPTSYKFEADPHAQEAKKAYDELLQRYGNAQHRNFLYAIRALWWEIEPPTAILESLASQALAAGNNPQTVVINSTDQSFQKAVNAARYCSVSPAVCRNDIWQLEESPETIRRLHRMVDLKEISGFFRLPIGGRDGCPGLASDEGFEKAENKPMPAPVNLNREIWLGNFAEDGNFTQKPAKIGLKDLTKHCLIVGMPGSGKTTLCFSILKQLWETYEIPFIVLEPAKTEYRGLKELPCFQDDLLVFTVGNETTSPFRFNPFEVPGGITLAEHLSTLKTCFSGAFNLFDPLPMILERALSEIYSDQGWYEFSVGGEDENLEPPMMQNLFVKALEIAQESSYRGEAAGNIRGALEQRLGSLTRGVKGRCFNTRKSIPFGILLNKPVVLELDALNDEEKALLMMFILSLVRANAKTLQRERKGELSHVVLVEEAHNVIGRGENQTGGNRANPQEISIRFFTRMLAEMRAWGEGIVIADQLPTAVAAEAVKNTKIKIMHKIVSADDRKFMGETMNLNDTQFEQAVALPPGQSLYFSGDESRSRLIIEPNFKQECENEGFVIEPPPDDWQIAAAMKSFRENEKVRDAFLPYAQCFNVCRACDSRLREEMERWADKKLSVIRDEIAERKKLGKVSAEAVAFTHILEAAQGEKENPMRSGCAVIHCNEKILPELKN